MGDTGLKWWWVSVVVIALDQLTKWLASAQLTLYQPLELLPMFNLTLSHNTGAAFSFLAQAGGWQRWFFSVVALLVSTLIVGWLRKLPASDRWHGIALTLILGGALGNVIDRLRFGYVVDFIDVYYGSWHWPAFNVADSGITVGAVIIAVMLVFGREQGVPSDKRDE